MKICVSELKNIKGFGDKGIQRVYDYLDSKEEIESADKDVDVKHSIEEQNIKGCRLFKSKAIPAMKKLVEEGVKVDCIITDPPYNISKDNNFKTMGRAGIDFGDWDKGFDLFSWIKYANKLLNPGGSMIIFNDWRNLGDISKYANSLNLEEKDIIRWRKSNPMPRNRDRRYITDYEFAIWLVKKGEKWTFNRLNDTYDRCEYCYPITPKSEKTGHPTQKPLALGVELVERHTNEGDLILDPFMGSGTFIEAAKKTGREAIGIDMQSKWFDVAKFRLEEE